MDSKAQKIFFRTTLMQKPVTFNLVTENDKADELDNDFDRYK